ncbi:Phytoene desaturase (lycopene-forming) [subsurface metagenome]
MPQQYDVIIVGGGHNGLVAAAYLAKQRLKVLVLEGRDIVGGACVTEELFPGYKVSTVSYVCSMFQPRITQELKLKEFGFEIYPIEATFIPFPNGKHLFLWNDAQKAAQEIERFSPRDAKAYLEFVQFLDRVAKFMDPLLLKPPPSLTSNSLTNLANLLRLAIRFRRQKDILQEIRMLTMSIKDFLDERFESEEVKAALAAEALIGSYGGPMTPGSAYIMVHYSLGAGEWGYVKGGMGTIPQALAQAAQQFGATIRTGAEVEHIIIKNGTAKGVVLTNGEEIMAKVIASNADPKRTFLKLVKHQHLDENFRQEIKNIKMRDNAIRINCALSELPDFKAYLGEQPGTHYNGRFRIIPSMEYVEKAWDDAKYGRPSQKPFLSCSIPTMVEPKLAPAGKHILNIIAQYAPYQLKGTTWDKIRDDFADRVIDTLAEYAPNVKSAIIAREVLTPFDFEERYYLTEGTIFHGEMSLDRLFFLRPVPGWANYRTPIDNLYLCGSGAHPGGGVMGAPGYNAAHKIIKDWKWRRLK